MAKAADLGGRTSMANHDIFPSLGSLLSSLQHQNNLQKFQSKFTGIKVTLWELLCTTGRSQYVSSGSGPEQKDKVH